MSRNIPKTGLAARMRDWMSRRKKPFTRERLCKELNILTSKEREKAIRALYDFEKRGEITKVLTKDNRRQYLYASSWRKKQKESVLKSKILKAMYISNTFSLTYIQRLSGAQKRSYLDKITKRLENENFVVVIGRRPRLNGYGIENIYHVVDSKRFRIEKLD